MGKTLDTPECDEVDMDPEFSCSAVSAKHPKPDTGTKAFYDDPASAGAAKVF
jgi:hypothetical protein